MVCHFGPDLKISTITVACSLQLNVVHGPQGMNPSDFGDPLTFHNLSCAGLCFTLISTQTKLRLHGDSEHNILLHLAQSMTPMFSLTELLVWLFSYSLSYLVFLMLFYG